MIGAALGALSVLMELISIISYGAKTESVPEYLVVGPVAKVIAISAMMYSGNSFIGVASKNKYYGFACDNVGVNNVRWNIQVRNTAYSGAGCRINDLASALSRQRQTGSDVAAQRLSCLSRFIVGCAYRLVKRDRGVDVYRWLPSRVLIIYGDVARDPGNWRGRYEGIDWSHPSSLSENNAVMEFLQIAFGRFGFGFGCGSEIVGVDPSGVHLDQLLVDYASGADRHDYAQGTNNKEIFCISCERSCIISKVSLWGVIIGAATMSVGFYFGNKGEIFSVGNIHSSDAKIDAFNAVSFLFVVIGGLLLMWAFGLLTPPS